MRMTAAISLPLLVLLVACGGSPDKSRADDDAANAEGEVLGGSISDAMLPLDQLKSQSPPLKAAPRSAAANSDTQGEGDAGEEPPAAEAPAQPPATPAPAPEPPAPSAEAPAGGPGTDG